MATSSKIKRIGGRRCVAFGCSNKKSDGCSLFSFPKDEKYKKLWVNEVKNLRQDFHIHNVHTGHSDLFPSCQHDSNATSRTKWIKPGTKASSKIETIVLAKTLLRDIGKLSLAEQTFPVEAYHSVINYFALKLLVFSYHGMIARLLLAALHYNENAQRKQATTRDRILRFAIKYPKYKKGGYSVRVVRRESTFDYAHKLLVAVAKLCISSDCDVDNLPNPQPPPPLSASCAMPNKQIAVREHMSRFSL
jgi:hypothetical protein